MSKTIRKIATYRLAKKTINDLYDKCNNCLIIHYSCESFYDNKDGKTPRITSIAVRYLKSAQTKSFSIHKIAELKKILISDISINYDMLEKEMLKDFFDFVKFHKTFNWIHWNMRDINYGFEALNHRAAILGTKAVEIPDVNKYDLARLLIDKYGKQYCSHPRLNSIVDFNKISTKHWLTGEDEAKAFENKEFVKLHQSTLSKVDILENLLKLTANDELKTKSSKKDIYGLSPQGLFELAKDHWLYSLILIIITSLFGNLLQKLL